MDLNRITPIGRLGTAILAPRTVDEGESAKQVTSFRFAVNFPFEDHATWFAVECWGDLVDVVRKLNLKKVADCLSRASRSRTRTPVGRVPGSSKKVRKLVRPRPHS